MNKKRIFALAFAVLMLLALAACGTKNNGKMGDMSGNGSAMTDEPKNAEEALTLHKELLEQENAILSENTEPVSYTHLDVYKRQDFTAMYRIMGDRPMTIRYLDPPLHDAVHSGEVGLLERDVYKRQPQRCRCRMRTIRLRRMTCGSMGRLG